MQPSSSAIHHAINHGSSWEGSDSGGRGEIFILLEVLF